MGYEWAFDIAKLGVFIACAYAIFRAYARHWPAPWSRRRLAVLGVLTLTVVGTKVIEDVLAKESGPVDEALLWFVRAHVPAVLDGFFAFVTLSGSAAFLAPVAVAGTLVLLWARRRPEAWLLGSSAIAAALLGWAVKAVVGRARPALWEAPWYWGSSFPSGHALNTAALSTAAALCVMRIWPRAGTLPMALAATWTVLVALSRLVIGVHWPSDVLAAICLGAFIPLAISVVFTGRVPAVHDKRPDVMP